MPVWISDLFSSTGIQTIAALISAAATVASATFAWLIYRLGHAQLRTFNRQADVAAQQAEIARQQADIAGRMADQENRLFVLTHRPRLVVDAVEFLSDEPGQFPGGNLPTVRISIVNIGGTPARILASSCVFYFGPRGLPASAAYRANNSGPIFNLTNGAIIAPGTSPETYYRGYKEGQNVLHNQRILSPDEANEYNNAAGPVNFYVLGEVRYSDDNGVAHEVKFARQWDGELRRFRSVPDTYYEREI